MADRYPHGTGVVKWVSTDWLLEHRKDKTLQIIDCQPNIHDYIAEHIPCAIYLNEGVLRSWGGGLPGAYGPADALQAVARCAGLRPDQPVVVYTGVGVVKKSGDGLEQTMFAYSLARFGHRNVFVLDGGIDKWKAEGKPLTQVFPKVRPSEFRARVHEEFFIEYNEFRSVKDDPEVLLLDARPPAVYEGQGPWPKPGHIPGAVNLPWASFMDPANTRLLRPDGELRALATAAGATPDKTIICSCGTGREATNEFLLFKWYLEYPSVRIYEGSFTEWTIYPSNPTVTGRSPR